MTPAAATTDQAPQVAALRRLAIARRLDAAAATRRYERSSWILYIIAVIGVPLVVSGLWVRMSAWHFTLAGIAAVVIAPAMMVLERRAANRRDRHVATAEQAHAAYRRAHQASTGRRHAGDRVASGPVPPIR